MHICTSAQHISDLLTHMYMHVHAHVGVIRIHSYALQLTMWYTHILIMDMAIRCT